MPTPLHHEPLWTPKRLQLDQQVERVVQAIDAAIADRYHMGPYESSLCHARVQFRSRLRNEINLMLIQMPERDYWKRP